jgi:CRP-like cAMP-binding protein
MALAQDVEFPAGRRIFEEKGRADSFWIIRDGDVSRALTGVRAFEFDAAGVRRLCQRAPRLRTRLRPRLRR